MISNWLPLLTTFMLNYIEQQCEVNQNGYFEIVREWQLMQLSPIMYHVILEYVALIPSTNMEHPSELSSISDTIDVLSYRQLFDCYGPNKD